MTLYVSDFNFSSNASLMYDLVSDKIYYKTNVIYDTCRHLIVGKNVVHQGLYAGSYDAWPLNTNPVGNTVYGEIKGFQVVSNKTQGDNQNMPYVLFPMTWIYIHSSMYRTREELYNDVRTCSKLNKLGQSFQEFQKEHIFTCDEFDEYVLEFARSKFKQFQQRLLKNFQIAFEKNNDTWNNNFDTVLRTLDRFKVYEEDFKNCSKNFTDIRDSIIQIRDKIIQIRDKIIQNENVMNNNLINLNMRIVELEDKLDKIHEEQRLFNATVTSEIDGNKLYNIQPINKRLSRLNNLVLELCQDKEIPPVLSEKMNKFIQNIDDYVDDDDEEDNNEKCLEIIRNIQSAYTNKSVTTVKQYKDLMRWHLDDDDDTDVMNVLLDIQRMVESLPDKSKQEHSQHLTTLCLQEEKFVLSSIDPVDTSSCKPSYEYNSDILTPNNLVNTAVNFYKQHNLSNNDFVETIQAMLESNLYTLGDDLIQNKMDFTEANTLFLAGVAPAKLDKKNLQSLLFKNVTCEDLI